MQAPVNVSLGCGREKKEGWIGLDIVDFGWNKIWDATRDQIPLADSSVDVIEAENFIEHIERRHWRDLFNECWRVLKPTGKIIVTVPNAAKSIELACADPTHVALWVPGTLKYLTGERPRNADYGFKPWIVLVTRDHHIEPRVHYFELRPKKS